MGNAILGGDLVIWQDDTIIWNSGAISADVEPPLNNEDNALSSRYVLILHEEGGLFTWDSDLEVIHRLHFAGRALSSEEDIGHYFRSLLLQQCIDGLRND